MKVYLAAPWKYKHAASATKDILVSQGFRVVSTWTEQPNEEVLPPAELRRFAQSDWDELREADTLVLLAYTKSEGKATELGGALAWGHRIVVVADDDQVAHNVFYHLPRVTVVPSLGLAMAHLLPYVTMKEKATC